MREPNRLKSANVIIKTLDEERFDEFLNIAEQMIMTYAENAVKEAKKKRGNKSGGKA